jgi:hypothetical protein
MKKPTLEGRAMKSEIQKRVQQSESQETGDRGLSNKAKLQETGDGLLFSLVPRPLPHLLTSSFGGNL